MTHTKTPWKLEVGKCTGDNWMVGSVYFGRGRDDGKDYWAHVTTDHVHASEMGDSNAKGDAELWVTACNSHDALLSAAKAALYWFENAPWIAVGGENEQITQLRIAIASAEPDNAEGREE